MFLRYYIHSRRAKIHRQLSAIPWASMAAVRMALMVGAVVAGAVMAALIG